MPTLLLLRAAPLASSEVAALPTGCLPVRERGDVVARARVPNLDEDDLLQLVFAMSQAAPGATLMLGELPPPVVVEAEPESEAEPEPEPELEPNADAASVADAVGVDDDDDEDDEMELPEPETEPAGVPEAAAAADDTDDTDEEPVDDGAGASPSIGEQPAEDTDEDPVNEAVAPPTDTREDTEEWVVDAPRPLAAKAPTAPIPSETLVPAAAAVPDAAAPADPWELWDTERREPAEAAFIGTSLDSEGRSRVRAMLQSTEPVEVAAGCRIARLTGWRSSVQSIRRLLGHADTRVRLDAVQAVGALAGPALVPALRLQLSDTSPEVRAAAVVALMKLESL